jgi:CheY-like chemotaxis protein
MGFARGPFEQGTGLVGLYKPNQPAHGPSVMDVLLVEDDPGDVRLIREAFRLSKNPINLHVIGDGMEAMAFLRQEGAHAHAARPHLILLDLNLPKMDGREVLASLKNDSSLKAIPTIVLTASEAAADTKYCYARGANCFVRKPGDWDAYQNVVAAINTFWILLVNLPG